MSDKKYTIQDFQDVTADGLLPRVRELKADGYRLAQMCATKLEEGFQILYTFDKDFNMTSAKFDEVQANIDDTSEEYIYSINIVLNAECKYEKNGEIKEADVKIPEDVLENLAP